MLFWWGWILIIRIPPKKLGGLPALVSTKHELKIQKAQTKNPFLSCSCYLAIFLFFPFPYFSLFLLYIPLAHNFKLLFYSTLFIFKLILTVFHDFFYKVLIFLLIQIYLKVFANCMAPRTSKSMIHKKNSHSKLPQKHA